MIAQFFFFGSLQFDVTGKPTPRKMEAAAVKMVTKGNSSVVKEINYRVQKS